MGVTVLVVNLGLASIATGSRSQALADTLPHVPSSRAEMAFSFAPLVKRVAPAVVNVYVTQRVKEFVSPFGDDPFFRDIFGNAPGFARDRIENSLGSGVIVSSDGLVVTNDHVVKGSGDAAIKIALADKREFDAKIILRDEKLDLVVLKLASNDQNFPFLEFDDSDRVEVGDLVLAIGDPFGVGQTVTSGIVSALARTAGGTADSDPGYFIQTDAAINPGNSGGALVDMSGRVIGINTSIYSRSGGSHGIGFAIPSNIAKPFVDSAITGKEVRRPWLGATLAAVDSDAAHQLGLEKVAGARITDVYQGSPAEQAGLRPNDVIIAVDDHDVEDPNALTYRLDSHGIGGSAQIKVYRAGQWLLASLPLEEATSTSAPSAQVDLSGSHPFDGARVAQITPQLASELRLSSDSTGVIVTSVQPESIAAGLDMRPGDIVLMVNHAKVKSVDDLERLLKKPQRLWRVDMRRGDRAYQIQIAG
jgi:Do/DeqQ family serine protease